MIKVSVIIPVYNVEPYLERCLDSVCSQTLSDIEIICINDGSADNSLKIIQEYAKKDTRIHLIDFKENKGAAAARNTGIDYASGEYVGFVDSDDFIDLDFYEKLYEKAAEDHADIAKSNLKNINWGVPSSGSYYNLADVRINKVKLNHVPTTIIKKKLLDENRIRYPEDLKCAEDSVFEVLISLAANKIAIVNGVSYYYFFRNESLNHTKVIEFEKIREIEKSMLRIVDLFNTADIDKDTYVEGLAGRYKYLSFFIKDKNPNEDIQKYVKDAEAKIFSQLKYADEFKKRELSARAKNLLFKKAAVSNESKIKTEKSKRNFLSLDAEELGINTIKRQPRCIVSLTSFPERMYDIHYCLTSLLSQSMKPDEVILWLGEEQFPNGLKDVPNEVLKLQQNGLTIKFTRDIKSYKKLIPALKEYPDEIIVTADDDVLYAKNWLEKLYNFYLTDRKNIVCHRAHKVKITEKGSIALYKYWDKLVNDNSLSCLNFFTGVGGILYPPHALYGDVLNEDLFMDLAPRADDIWFWAMAVLNDRKIKIAEDPFSAIVPVNYEREYGLNGETTLFSMNIVQNDIQLKNVLAYYPQILEKLKQEILINA